MKNFRIAFLSIIALTLTFYSCEEILDDVLDDDDNSSYQFEDFAGRYEFSYFHDTTYIEYEKFEDNIQIIDTVYKRDTVSYEITDEYSDRFFEITVFELDSTCFGIYHTGDTIYGTWVLNEYPMNAYLVFTPNEIDTWYNYEIVDAQLKRHYASNLYVGNSGGGDGQSNYSHWEVDVFYDKK